MKNRQLKIRVSPVQFWVWPPTFSSTNGTPTESKNSDSVGCAGFVRGNWPRPQIHQPQIQRIAAALSALCFCLCGCDSAAFTAFSSFVFTVLFFLLGVSIGQDLGRGDQ